MNLKLLRWAIIALLAVGAVAFILVGANGPKNPKVQPAEGQVTLHRTPVPPFGEIGFHVEGASTEAQAVAARCALLADTAAQQAQGLMNRTDLSGYDGMLFRFSADTTVSFWMKDTPLPLSIAFFDYSGQFVSTTDMAPCIHQSSCPVYSAAGPYRFALEVPQGGMPRLGIAPGTRLVTTPTCS